MQTLGRRTLVAVLLCALAAPGVFAGSGDSAKRQYRLLLSGMT
jgi:hypothetical protein